MDEILIILVSPLLSFRKLFDADVLLAEPSNAMLAATRGSKDGDLARHSVARHGET